jgi:phosphoribosylglycinamide formyltransferase 1
VPTLDLGVLVSGNGTNLQAILDAIAQKKLDARVRLVVSNRPGVRALERAESAGVESQVVDHKQFSSREAFDTALVEALRAKDVELVVLAGFMRVLTPQFLEAFPGRIVNIHPALLPSFAGLRAVAQTLEYGVKVAGVTVHFVDEGMDSGPIILQEAFELPYHRGIEAMDEGEIDAIEERFHEIEHRLLPLAVRLIAAGRVSIDPDDPRQVRVESDG